MHASSLSRMESEIATQTRLANLYQSSRDELRTELAGLTNARTQLQDTLNQALARQEQAEKTAQLTADKLRSELDEAQRTIDDLAQQKDELARQVQQLREELQDVPQLGEGGNFLSSGSRGAGDSALSVTHTTTTSSTNVQIGQAELYAKYIAALDQLRTEKHESRLIEQYLQQIQREISEKAPLIEQQRFAYNKLITLNTTLTDKMQQAQAEAAHWQQECAKISKQREQESAELSHARQESDDLARQVRSLLRGKSRVSDPSDMSRLGAQALISESLVEVDDVDDVQRQNQKLLAVVREISKQNEEMQIERQRSEQQQAEEMRTKQSLELQAAYASIEQMQEQRKGLEIRLEALLHGASLHSAAGGADEGRMVVMDPQSLATAAAGGLQGNPAATASLMADLQQQLRDRTASHEHDKADWQRDRAHLHQQLTDVQNQLVLLKNEHSVTVQHMSGSLDQARSTASESRLQLVTVQNELKSFQHLYAELKSTKASLDSEINTLRSRSAALNDSMIASAKAMQALTQDKARAEDTAAKLTGENASLAASLSLSNKASARYATENAELTSQLSALNKLVANLQSMQSLMQSREESTRNAIVTEKEQLRVDWVSCKQQLDEERRAAREMDKHLQTKLSDMQDKLDSKQSELSSVKEQLIESRTLQVTAVARVAQLEVDLKTAQESLSSIQSARLKEKEDRESMLSAAEGPGKLTKEQQLALQVQKLSSENAELSSAIAEQKAHVANLSSLAQKTEKDLQSVTMDSRLYRLSTEKQLGELRSSKQTLTARIEKLVSDIKSNEVESASAIDAAHSKISVLENQLSDAQRAKVESEKISAEYVHNLARLQAEIAELAKQAQDNQAKYEQELQNHSRTVSELSAKRNEIQSVAAKNADLSKELAALQSQTTSLQEANRQLTTELAESTAAFQSQLAASKSQHELLYGQLEVLSIQLKRLQENQNIESMRGGATGATAMESEAGAEGDAATSASASSSQQLADLHSIIKFLRKEKEELAVQYERQLQVQSRSENQMEQMRKQIQDLQDELQAEVSKRVAGAQSGSSAAASAAPGTTAADHTRLLSQLNQLSMLEESNSMLRDEAAKSAAKVRELQSALDRLDASVSPLRARIDQLESEKSVLSADLSSTRLENSRWSGRYQKLLNQSEFIDPEVHNIVKAEVEQLKQEKVALEEELGARNIQTETIKQQLAELESRHHKMKEAAQHWSVHACTVHAERG